MTFVFSVVGFIIAISLLISFHEFGHFWIARRFGIKVLRFSLGFGKTIYRRTFGADNTEFVVAALPFGGYVKMLDEREAPVAKEELHRAFNRRSLGVRTAVVVAGPLANLLLAAILYFVIFTIGNYGVRPVIGELVPDSTAMDAGLMPRDEITAVAGEPVRSWRETAIALIDVSLDADEVTLDVAGANGTRRIHLRFPDENLIDNDVPLLERLGIKPWVPEIPPVVGGLVTAGSGERSGLRMGDRILAFDGGPVETWKQLARQIRENPDRSVPVEIERAGQVTNLVLAIGHAETEEGGRHGRVGIKPHIPEELLQNYRVHIRYPPLEAVGRAFARMIDMTLLTYKFIWRMVTGDLSLQNISGPLTIAEFAGTSLLLGLATYLTALALLSISIGVLNLLPVPLLDGGHLLYYLIELIKGSPLSPAAEARGQMIGIALVGALILLALYNDFQRLLS